MKSMKGGMMRLRVCGVGGVRGELGLDSINLALDALVLLMQSKNLGLKCEGVSLGGGKGGVGAGVMPIAIPVASGASAR